jgi:hypothetical protein
VNVGSVETILPRLVSRRCEGGPAPCIAPSSPVLLAEFDLESESGRKPGAAASMGVGRQRRASEPAPPRSKASVEGDTARMAKTVATEIEDLMVAQQWIPPMKTSKQSETAHASQ